MKNQPNFQGKTYGILGVGRSGLAAAAFLRSKGAFMKVWDDNKTFLDQACSLGYEKLTNDLSDLSGLVVSPGVPVAYEPHSLVEKAQEMGIPLLNDLDLFYNQAPQATYIGITGTNGKSTTTYLVEFILQTAGISAVKGGNVGVPLLSLEPNQEATYVLEMSSFQLDLLQDLTCDVAVFLNLTPDHLDRHGSFEKYREAKEHIFDRQTPSSRAALVSVDDGPSRAVYEKLSQKQEPSRAAHLIPFSVKEPVKGGLFVQDGWIVDDRKGQAMPLISVLEMPTLRGTHNYQNALAAVGVALELGVDKEIIQKALHSFPGVPHRQENVGVSQGVAFVNDSKATNVEAACRALEVYDSLYWIAGGQWKGDDLSFLKAYASKIRHAYYIGAAASIFLETFQEEFPGTVVSTLEEAVIQAWEAAREKGGVVLLSPACASFDQFKNFEHRGNVFKQSVQSILVKK